MNKRMTVAALSLVGVALATYLTLYKLGIIGQLACTVGECETVNLSRWSVFLGLPVGSIFQHAQREMQLGVPVETALWRVAKTVQTDEFNFLIVAMSIQRDTGGNLAETLANLSALLRARQQLRLKIRAFTSEARTTMLIMAGLPFLVGGGLFLISPGYIGPLFTTESGQMIAAAAGCSMGIGIFVMNKIATIKV